MRLERRLERAHFKKDVAETARAGERAQFSLSLNPGRTSVFFVFVTRSPLIDSGSQLCFARTAKEKRR